MNGHELRYTGHEHLGQASHLVTGACTCGSALYATHTISPYRALRNLREQHNRHIEKLKEEESESQRPPEGGARH